MICAFSHHFLPFSDPESLEGNQVVLYRVSSGHYFSTNDDILAVTPACRRYICTCRGDYGLSLGATSNSVVFFDENGRSIGRCGRFSFFWPEFYKYRDLLSGWSFLRFVRVCLILISVFWTFSLSFIAMFLCWKSTTRRIPVVGALKPFLLSYTLACDMLLLLSWKLCSHSGSFCPWWGYTMCHMQFLIDQSPSPLPSQIPNPHSKHMEYGMSVSSTIGVALCMCSGYVLPLSLARSVFIIDLSPSAERSAQRAYLIHGIYCLSLVWSWLQSCFQTRQVWFIRIVWTSTTSRVGWSHSQGQVQQSSTKSSSTVSTTKPHKLSGLMSGVLGFVSLSHSYWLCGSSPIARCGTWSLFVQRPRVERSHGKLTNTGLSIYGPLVLFCILFVGYKLSAILLITRDLSCKRRVNLLIHTRLSIPQPVLSELFSLSIRHSVEKH
jgi:hypothetical protein